MTREELLQLFLDTGKVSTDTRKLIPGSLFFALKGANFNGNDFAPMALKSGCTAAIVDDHSLKNEEGCFLVQDVLTSLQHLATDFRNQFDIPFLAITGSNGKTTTKELMRDVLAKKFRVHATRGNFNNHIGVPLTLLEMPRDAEFAIIEMGANHQREIAALAEIARPDYGMITNIGKAHLEGFGGVEGVIKGKGELFDFLRKSEGKAFVNTELQHLSSMSADLETIDYSTFSKSMFCDLGEEDGKIWVEWCPREVRIQTQLSGEYNAHNLASAVVVGTFFDVSPEAIIEAIEAYVPDNQRSQIVITDKNKIVLDSYNANPTSMRAALENLVRLENPFFIIGDMLELGPYSEEEHAAILSYALKLGLTGYLVGQEFKASKGDHRFEHFNDRMELKKYLQVHKLEGKTVLLKGSRGIRLEELLEDL